MTTTLNFWQDPAFEEFLPYIVVQPAHDTRGGRNRLEVSRWMPLEMLGRALLFRGPCAKCARTIRVFRPRVAGGGVYLAVTCPLDVSIPCSRGGASTAAYQAIAALAKYAQGEADQQSLL